MHITGSCHCKNIAFTLDWPTPSTDTVQIAARACSCSFCVKHGGVWTARPDATLALLIQQPQHVRRYAFATQTAQFHLCSHCGVVPLVTSEIEGKLYAVVNVNTFDNFPAQQLQIVAASFDGESEPARLARRQKNWIAQVSGVPSSVSNP